jgi:hypothetical protein
VCVACLGRVEARGTKKKLRFLAPFFPYVHTACSLLWDYKAVALAAALAESALGSESEEHKAGPWEYTPSHLYGFDGLYADPDSGSDDDFDNPHGDWLDFG